MKLFPIMCIVLLTGCPLLTVVESDECRACRWACDEGPRQCDECEQLRAECHEMTQEMSDE